MLSHTSKQKNTPTNKFFIHFLTVDTDILTLICMKEFVCWLVA